MTDLIKEVLAEKSLEELIISAKPKKKVKLEVVEDIPWSKELVEKVLAEFKKGSGIMKVASSVKNRAGKNLTRRQVTEFYRIFQQELFRRKAGKA